jgi:hypothetical protein
MSRTRQREAMTTKLFTLADVRAVELPRHTRADGELVVAEAGGGVPYSVARMFTVKASGGAERGMHAHRLCSQFMICVTGIVDVVCNDGREKQTFALDRNNLGLLVPPTIWCSEIYRQPDSILAVLCDRRYEESDYIRDYAQFVAMRGQSLT